MSRFDCAEEQDLLPAMPAGNASDEANEKEKKPEPVPLEVAADAPPKVKKPARRSARTPFYIVGMGGSAGALEAFEQFFAHLPPDSGLAYVLVPHLDPTHKGLMPELVQRFTRMKVVQAEDGMKVRPNSVYIIPPNRDMSMLHGTIQLLEPSAPRGLRLPIDFFFRHLAEDQKERAICIILSGMGTDGTLGLKAVKEKLGMAMVQKAESAKYDGMPRSAIATGLADYIAPVQDLPAKLIEYVTRSARISRARPEAEGKAVDYLQKIFVLLRAQTGNDFSLYKKNTVYRRIERRMGVHQIDNMAHYVRYLQENPQEIDLLFKELLIGVTSFFRDPEAFEALARAAVSHLPAGPENGTPLRIWVPGCSSGEEAYSVAIILRESLDRLKQKGAYKIQTFATDIDKDAVEKARQGVYPLNIAADVSPERLDRFFTRDEHNYRVKKEIREMVVFAVQNITMDPPFTKLDMLACRNLLIYLTSELQKKLVPLFHYALKPGGILFLGSAETIGGFTHLFSPLDHKWRIFARREAPSALLDLPSSLFSREFDRIEDMGVTRKEAELAIPGLAQKILLENYAPPAVLINDRGDIVYIHGRTGKYLEPSAGKANMNIFAMAREGLRFELGSAVRRATAQNTDVVMRDLKVRTNGGYQITNLTVKPVTEPQAVRGLLMVIFEDVATPFKEARAEKEKTGARGKQNAFVAELQKELQYTKEHLQTSMEEMETSQEELKSANEELQSTNEELQSTNEELTTSKEELQSVNEELMSVNAELQGKIDELSWSNNDMKNLLNGTEIATIFLDNDLNVKRFTAQATKIVHLIQSDVGRPITHMATSLTREDLVEDVHEVLRTLVYKETQVQTKDGRWYMMRILPYRTVDNVIDGVVITLGDISPLKELEGALREKERAAKEARDYAEGIVATVREPLLVLDGGFKVVSANQSFYRMFRVTAEETEGCLLFDLGRRQWDIPALRQLLEEIIPQSTEFHDFVVEHEFPDIGRKVMLLNARRIQQEAGRTRLILLAMEDVTEKQK